MYAVKLSHLEVGYNTSTTALQVVEGDNEGTVDEDYEDDNYSV
jgi:hypothetical protein